MISPAAGSAAGREASGSGMPKRAGCVPPEMSAKSISPPPRVLGRHTRLPLPTAARIMAQVETSRPTEAYMKSVPAAVYSGSERSLAVIPASLEAIYPASSAAILARTSAR